MQLIDTKDLKMFCSKLPEPYARTISPFDDPLIKKDKNEFPFKQRIPVDFQINYKNESYNFLFEDYKNDVEGFKYNGANIPKGSWWLMGSNADPYYLIASYFHDIFCNNKKMLGNNRYLSSLIFKELLIACGVSRLQSNIMFVLVDNYQKFQKW